MSNFTIHNFKPQSKEWLNARLKYITATESACLFEMGNKSIAKLMEEKLTPPEPIKNEFMTIGIILEPAVIESFRVRMGLPVEPAHPTDTVFITHNEHRLSATPDGKLEHEGEFYVVECKTAGSKCPERAMQNVAKWKDQCPIHYMIQVHTQLAVTGADKALIGVMGYTYPLPFIAYEITKSEEITKMLFEEADRFWHCLENDELFEVNKKYKRKLKKLLDEHAELVYTNI